jgi:hypothetical protein
MYSHPHSAPEKLPMGKHKMEHCWTQVNITSPTVLEAAIIEIQRQFARLKVIQSLNVVIITIEVETIVLNMNVVRVGVVIGFRINLGHGSSRFSVGRNLNRSLGLPIRNTRVVSAP